MRDMLHMVIDMQRLFDEETVWHTPMLREVLPNVLRLCEGFRGQNAFARFVVPETAEAATGTWARYYQRWDMLTGKRIDRALLDLVAELQPFAAKSLVIDKLIYSPFKVAGVTERLLADGVRHIVFSGVETDVCVLAAVMDAMDLGFDVTIAIDAVGSSAREAHEAALRLIYPRCEDQIRLATTEQILSNR